MMMMRTGAISCVISLRQAAGIATIASLTMLAGAGAAMAAEAKLLSQHRDWNAYSFDEGGAKKVCYISGNAKSSEPKGAKRSQIYAMVTHRPGENAHDVFSVVMGYPLRKGGEVVVEIDKKSFNLFSDGETGWAHDAETDRALAQALRSGSKMTVKGVSQRGTKTVDSYSLNGAGAALEAADHACNVKR